MTTTRAKSKLRLVKKTKTKTKAAPLTRYLYVEARGWFAPIIDGDGPAQVLDGPISFDSLEVFAKDEETAYQLGAAKLQNRQADDDTLTNQETGEPLEGEHTSGQFLNDYVVAL